MAEKRAPFGKRYPSICCRRPAPAFSANGFGNSAVHSQTLPTMLYRPKSFEAKDSAGAVADRPSAQPLVWGNRPCQMLQGMKSVSSGSSSPQESAHPRAHRGRHVPILPRSANGRQPRPHRRRHHAMTYAPPDVPGASRRGTVRAMDLSPVCPLDTPPPFATCNALCGACCPGTSDQNTKDQPHARPR